MNNIYYYIQSNLEKMRTLDPTIYPNLFYYKASSTAFKRLEALLRLFQSKDKPVVTIDEKAYFLYSQRHARRWSKREADCGGTEQRWQSHKVFLKDLGLIETYTVTGPDENPILNRIWETACNKQQCCETLWTVPLYNEDVLHRAEHIAGLYHERHISISDLRKNVVIRFRGKKHADWLYWPDLRDIGKEEKALLFYCREAIREAVETKGYTTFKEMITRVHAICNGRQYFQQMLAELLNPEEQQNRYQSVLNLILEEKSLLCFETGCDYRRIRKQDRMELSLSPNLRSWIIVPKE